MALKINNEVKIGILVIVAVAALIFGIRMLQGKGLFDSGKDLYAYYDDATGLQNSAPVVLKGVSIGRVKDIEITEQQKIKVTIHVNDDMDIPLGSKAELSSTSMLSSDKVIAIHFPETPTKQYLNDGETIDIAVSAGLLGDIGDGVKPILKNVDGTVQNIDSLVLSLNNIVNFETQQRLNSTFRNLDVTVGELSKLASALNQQTAALSGIMKNVNGFTGNLNENNYKISNILTNAETATNSLTGPEIKETLKSLQSASDNLNNTLTSINSTDGTLGLLTKDRKMYDNIVRLSESLDALMIDLKNHPGRYINVSVFGSSKRD